MPIRAGESFGSHWVRSGLPFIGFMVMGSVGISVLLQGRNDVRDAASDVTDLRAPARQQRVRKKNRSFSMEGENESTIESLGGQDKYDSRTYENVPLPRPWEEPRAVRRRWWAGVKRWFRSGES